MNAEYISSTFREIDDLTKCPLESQHLSSLLSQINHHDASQIDNHKLDSDVLHIASLVEAQDYPLLYSLGTHTYADIPCFQSLLAAINSFNQARADQELVAKTGALIEALKVDFFPAVADFHAGVLPRDSDISRQCHDLVQAEIDSIASEMRIRLQSELDSALVSLQWGSPDYKLPHDITEIRSITDQLIRLQAATALPTYPEPFHAIQSLVLSLSARFVYHFATPERNTSKPSKPEWALEYIEKFLGENASALMPLISDSLAAYGRIPMFEIITATLVPLRGKLAADTRLIIHTNLEKSARLLTHLVYEVAAFDLRIKKTYLYRPAGSPPWTGLTSEILLVEDGAAPPPVIEWLKVERDLALKRYQSEIINISNAFDVDMDYHPSGRAAGGATDGDDDQDTPQSNNTALPRSNHVLCPTFSAYNLVKLFTNLITHFQSVGAVKHQLKYVSSVHLSLLQDYATVLQARLRNYNESHNAAAMLALLPGALQQKDAYTDTLTVDLKSALDPMLQLLGTYCLAKFVLVYMQEWSLQPIFIDLFQFYHQKAPDDPLLSLFDASVSTYEDIAEQCMQSIKDLLAKTVKQCLKAHVNTAVWDADGGSDGAGQLPEPSRHLAPLSMVLPQLLEPVRQSVSGMEYLCACHSTLTSLCHLVMEYIVTNNNFTGAGVVQLRVDTDYMFSQLADALWVRGPSPILSTDRNVAYRTLRQLITLMQWVWRQDRPWDSLGIDCLSDEKVHDLTMRVIT